MNLGERGHHMVGVGQRQQPRRWKGKDAVGQHCQIGGTEFPVGGFRHPSCAVVLASDNFIGAVGHADLPLSFRVYRLAVWPSSGAAGGEKPRAPLHIAAHSAGRSIGAGSPQAPG